MIKLLMLLFLNSNSLNIKGEKIEIFKDIERGYSAIYNGEYFEGYTKKDLKKQIKNQ